MLAALGYEQRLSHDSDGCDLFCPIDGCSFPLHRFKFISIATYAQMTRSGCELLCQRSSTFNKDRILGSQLLYIIYGFVSSPLQAQISKGVGARLYEDLTPPLRSKEFIPRCRNLAGF